MPLVPKEDRSVAPIVPGAIAPETKAEPEQDWLKDLWAPMKERLGAFNVANPWAMPGAVMGALGGAGSTMFSRQFSFGDFLLRALLGALLGGGAGYGIPKLQDLLGGGAKETPEAPAIPAAPAGG